MQSSRIAVFALLSQAVLKCLQEAGCLPELAKHICMLACSPSMPQALLCPELGFFRANRKPHEFIVHRESDGEKAQPSWCFRWAILKMGAFS